MNRSVAVGAGMVHGCGVRSWMWFRCSPSCLRMIPQNLHLHTGILSPGSLDSFSVCTGICNMPVFAFYTHLDRAETPIASFAGKHIIFCRPASNLLKASISSFDSVRERALPRGSSRVVRIAASAQFVSLFLVFLRPRLVF